MDIAIKGKRTILTFDSDYGELIFKKQYKPPNGVIYLRFREFSPIYPGEFIEKLIEHGNIDFAQTLTVCDSNGIRQRKY